MAVAAAAADLPPESKLAPFNPASDTAIAAAVRFLALQPGDVAIDVGSGDGRVLAALAASCSEARILGVEYNSELAARALARISAAGLANAQVICADATRPEHQPEHTDAAFVYLTPGGLATLAPFLERVIQQRGRGRGRVVSNAFRIPGWAERGWLRETVRDPHGLAAYCYGLPPPLPPGPPPLPGLAAGEGSEELRPAPT